MQAQPDTLTAPGTAHYVDQFERLQKSLPGQNLDWLEQQRRRDLERFSKVGFPTQRDEDWRYTPLRPITSKAFSAVSESALAGAPVIDSAVNLESFKIPALDSYQIIFIDGQHDSSQSAAGLAQAGVTIETMSSVLENQPQSIEKLLGSVLTSYNHGFTSLNNAFYKDGVVIRLAENAQLDKPIELVFLSQSEMMISQPRNLVVAEKNSKAQIIERYVSIGDSHTLTNSATEIILEQNAELDYHVVQTQSKSAYQVCGIWAKQAAGSRFSCRTITLGGALVRNDLRTELNGPKAHCDMFGVFNLTGKQHVDNHTTIAHNAEDCTSSELYKGVLDQRARGVFHGRIKVAPDAQKTDAQQTNNTLLLSPDAEIDTKPQLEIYADDVKCSHGATIGQIDESALFYLRSRGIDQTQARALLTYAFVHDVLNRINIEPLKQWLEQNLVDQLVHEE